MKYDRTIIAYHGCDRAVARRLLAGEPFRPSENRYDWLGRGVYFWEFGPDRALRFTEFQRKTRRVRNPDVVGALIQLGDCFDLMDTRYTAELAEAFGGYRRFARAEGIELPSNAGRTPDRKLRYRDCAVINFYLQALEAKGIRMDTVRGAFTEGRPAFPGSGIRRETHVQIAVRNPRCILGVFRPMISA